MITKSLPNGFYSVSIGYITITGKDRKAICKKMNSILKGKSNSVKKLVGVK